MEFMRVLRRAASILLLAAAILFLARSLFELGQEVAFRDAVPGSAALLLSALLSAGWLFAMVAGWIWVLRFHTRLSALPQLRVLFSAFMRAFMSRYIPGKVWPALVLWERLHGALGASPVIRSYLLQQIHLLASAGVLSVGALPLVLSRVEHDLPWAGISIGIAVAIGLSWALLPKPLFSFAHRWAPVKWREHLIFEGGINRWALGFGIFLLVGVLQGAAVIPLWQAVAEPEQQLDLAAMVAVVCAYAAARIVGQGVAIVPAGIGVREGVFVLLVSGLSREAALISVLWLRLIATAMEALAWAASAWLAGRGTDRGD